MEQDQDQELKHMCNLCNKSFPCGRSLGGHMRSHVINDPTTQEKQNKKKKLPSVDNGDQSDNKTATPNRKKRSSRRTKRYNNLGTTAATTSSSLSFNANASSSVSEIEQEQEEVAMCLILLSKDVGQWGDLNSIGQSSDNNSKGVEELEFQGYELEMEKNLIKEIESDQKPEKGTKKHNPNKRKGFDIVDPELGVKYSEMCNENWDMKVKFECASCNKAFSSFQALGGHRASHKKMKGCFGLKNNVVTGDDNTSPIDQEIAGDAKIGTKKMNKVGSHECPICFRIFSSGQALGGHKRSHLIAEAKNNQSSSIATSIGIQKPIPEKNIRDFLDLNLPAPDEEDTSNSELGFKPWWIGSNHKHEPLLSLLSN